MKKLTLSALASLLIAPIAPGQDSRIYSRPAIPAQAALDRLNLKMAWRTYLPVDGRRDGLLSVQLLEKQILVQLRSGMIVSVHPETGRTQWMTRVGIPYRTSQALGFNDRTVFAVNGVNLHALDRATGQRLWEFALPTAPSAPPVADAERVYLCYSDWLYTYDLPKSEMDGGVLKAVGKKPGDKIGDKGGKMPDGDGDKMMDGEKKPDGDGDKKPDEDKKPDPGNGDKKPDPVKPAPGSKPLSVLDLHGRGTTATMTYTGVGGLAGPGMETGPRPLYAWNFAAPSRIEQTPVLTVESVVLAGADGTFFATSKFASQLLYRFPTEGPITAPLGFHGETAYVASHDSNVYAFNIITGRNLWRYTGGSRISHKPEVTDEDIYITPEKGGLIRLERDTGLLAWRTPSADRFVASNRKLVYAMDRSGRLVILDRARGTVLSSWDTRDFVVPISNEMTDRLFLAANDGLMICLHDRANPTPLRNKKAEIPDQAKNGKPPADKNPDEKPAPDKPPDKPPANP